MKSHQTNRDLRNWLGNMVWHHQFSADEIAAATGLSADEIAASLKKFDISAATKPRRAADAPLLVGAMSRGGNISAMKDRNKKPGSPVVVIILAVFLLPVLYVVSVGPAGWLVAHNLSHDSVIWFYEPLSSISERCQWFDDLVVWYHSPFR